MTDKKEKIKKDIFWKSFFIFGFLAMYAIGLLHNLNADKPIVVAIIVGIAFFFICMSPTWFYEKVKGFYTEKKEEYKIFYNWVLFIVLSSVAYSVANAINLFVFNKNKFTDAMLIVFLDFLAFILSTRITQKKFGGE